MDCLFFKTSGISILLSFFSLSNGDGPKIKILVPGGLELPVKQGSRLKTMGEDNAIWDSKLAK